MKKLTFSLLFFTAIAWLWIVRVMGADGALVNVSGTTTVGGAVSTLNVATINNNTGGGYFLINGSGGGLWEFAGQKIGFGGGAAGTYTAYIEGPSDGNILVSTNLTARGTVTATNGYNFVGATTLCTLTNVVYTNSTLDFGSTAATSFSDLLVPIANLKSNDVGTINAPAIAQTNGMFTLWISNTTCYARYHNIQATAVNPASGIYNIQVFQYK